MFIGEYQHNLDSKGRISIPAKFRSELGSSAIVTRGLDSCLFIYPKSEWEETANRLAQLPYTNANARAFSRMMLSGAMEVEIDKQGRALLPGYLRSYASLIDQIVSAGVFNRVEIWDKQKWQEYSQQSESQAANIAEQLTEWRI